MCIRDRDHTEDLDVSCEIRDKSTNNAAALLKGIFSNAVTSHAIAIHDKMWIVNENAHVRFDGKVYYSLYQRFNEHGIPIVKELSLYLAKALDDIKNPTLQMMNINERTAYVITLLVRAGVNKKTVVNFIKQPILDELVAEDKKMFRIVSDRRSVTLIFEKLFKKYFNLLHETLDSMKSEMSSDEYKKFGSEYNWCVLKLGGMATVDISTPSLIQARRTIYRNTKNGKIVIPQNLKERQEIYLMLYLSAASDVYKRQVYRNTAFDLQAYSDYLQLNKKVKPTLREETIALNSADNTIRRLTPVYINGKLKFGSNIAINIDDTFNMFGDCLLYTSPSPRD